MEKNKKSEKPISITGLDLQRASMEHQLVMLIKQHLPYGELDTGWLVRTKDMDKEHRFGLKARKNDRYWSVYDYNDVVAWGYADGGLNSDHFNSCRMRPEDWPQFAGQPQDETTDCYEDDDFDDTDRHCVKFRYEDGQIHYNAVVYSDEERHRGGTKLMHAAAKVFDDFRKEHPEVTEMHFYTDDEVKVEN